MSTSPTTPTTDFRIPRTSEEIAAHEQVGKEMLLTAAEDRAARAESWLFDIVSGLARNADDWEPVAKHGALLEPRAREITKTVLSPEFMERMARSRW